MADKNCNYIAGKKCLANPNLGTDKCNSESYLNCDFYKNQKACDKRRHQKILESSVNQTLELFEKRFLKI